MGRMEREGRFSSAEEDEFEPSRVMVDFIASGRWLLVRRHQLWTPPTDVYETDSSVIVRVEVAGMERQDFQVVLSGDTLTISGVRRDPATKLGYHQMEIRYGEFATQVRIRCPVNQEGVEASYDNGFLCVTLPKAR